MDHIMTSTLLFIFALISPSLSINLQITQFDKYVQKTCYKSNFRGEPYPLGQQGPAGPLGLSMENLISLIEKIEDSPNIASMGLRPDQLASMILTRFHIDDYEYIPNGNLGYWYLGTAPMQRACIAQKLLLDSTRDSVLTFPEEVLTEDEECSMYFMLSHSINQTATANDRRSYSTVYSAPPIPSRIKSRFGQNKLSGPRTRYVTENPREIGVVSFRNNEQHAIAPARVLKGIIASVAPQFSTVRNLLGPPCNDGCRCLDLTDDLATKGDSQIDVLMAVTLTDILAYGSGPTGDRSNEQPNFGIRGDWNSTLCQVEYKLTQNSTRGSLAEIRGGIDGLALGKAAREQNKNGVAMKLSSMLRMYYSPMGLKDEITSVCSRRAVSTDMANLKEQAKNYMVAYAASVLNTATISDGRINEFVNQYERAFNDAVNRAYELPAEDRDWCDSRSRGDTNNVKNAISENPSSVVVMIDMGSEIEKQMEIVKHISNGLDMRKRGSDMSVVANTKGGGYPDDDLISTDGLSRFAWNSSNRGCVTCRLAWADLNNMGTPLRNSPDVLLRAINVTLRDLKRGRANQLVTPGKSFVFFNYGSVKKPTGDLSRYNAEKNDLYVNHRDVPLLMVGQGNKADLEELAYNDQTDVFEEDAPDPSILAKRLLERISKTPVTMQHPNCLTETSQNLETTGFVTPGRKQQWALYPEYFIKSYNVEFEFKAITGPIKICYSRGYTEPEQYDRNCKPLKPGDEPLKYTATNPCKNFGLHDCPIFYFTIFGEKEGSTVGSGKCKKDECLNMDQIEWTVSHTGVSCNSASTLISSLFLPFALLVILFTNKQQL